MAVEGGGGGGGGGGRILLDIHCYFFSLGSSIYKET